MTEGIAQLTLGFHPCLPVTVAFAAPQISSEAGVWLRRQVDDRLGLSPWFADVLPDERDPAKVQHERREQVRQRLYQSALGYEEGNDADRLRDDPLLKSVCDRTPDDTGLSSQPTLSRLENAIDARSLRALLLRLEEHSVRSLPSTSEVIGLDLDTNDAPTYGQQQLSFFHGYSDHHIYHPVMIFDGDSGQVVTAVVRPGNTHAARGVMGTCAAFSVPSSGDSLPCKLSCAGRRALPCPASWPGSKRAIESCK